MQAKARKSKMSLSKYCRTCALEKEIIVIEGLGKLIPELNKIGSNINQIAYMLNSYSVQDYNFLAIKLEIESLVEEVYYVLRKEENNGDFETD